uniref:Lipocalin/cytosolic fatty-acid binding domain-containing protein n=2 Tax=Sus scrofa TaxID=9823 RepID=A0A8D2C1Y1_PIG
MKILLLSLVLGLACAQEPQTEQDPTQGSRISGKWKTLYVAASNREKTSENGPFHAYMHWIHFENGNNKIFFKFFVKVKGKCTEISAKRRKVAPNVYEDAGKNELHFVHVSKNALILYNINVDKDKKTISTELNSRGDKAEEQDFKKFKEVMRQKGIPEENVMNVPETDDCPMQ